MIKGSVRVLQDEELQIIAGELYEVWLKHDWESPKLCVPIIQIATSNNRPNWEILIDGKIECVYASQIFERGKSTRPTKYEFPKIVRNNSALFVNEIVEVQPMTAPTGSIFYFA